MQKRRQQRLQSVLTEEVAIFFSRLDGGILTITSVELSPDFREATVWYSALGEPAIEVRTQLEQQLPELTAHLRQRLDLKYLPSFRFRLDPGLTHQAKIERRLLER